MRQKLECWKAIPPLATTHAGLWLDAFIGEQSRDNTESKRCLVQQVAQLAVSDPYVQFFTRWEEMLKTYCPVSPRPAKVRTRLAVGLGGAGVLETAITLHHTYGVPYIPGSALKGLAASYVRQCLSDQQWGQWGPDEKGELVWEPGKAYRLIFGDTTSAGYITFFDALYMPGSGHGGTPLHPDIITVHHPDYYQNKDKPPADWDSPTPVPFLTATGDYLVALAAPAVADWIAPWIEQTFTILAQALDQWGVGAKTSSGYGRMELQMPAPPPGLLEVQDLLARLNDLPDARVATEINRFVTEWRNLSVDQSLRQQVAQAIINKVRAAGREKNSRNKPWFQELLASSPESDNA